MIKIFVIHNREEDRLSYLVPRLEDLALGLTKAGYPTTVCLVGPDVDLVQRYRTAHNALNRVRRAFYASLMFCHGAALDPRPTHRKWLPSYFFERLHDLFVNYKRSIRMEQEVNFAHTHARRLAAQADEYALILESDAVVTDRALPGLVSLMDYVRAQGAAAKRLYVDLAGGCDRELILHSWCYKEEYGCRRLALMPGLTALLPPRLAANTAGGYLVSPRLAAELADFALRRRTYCGVDWNFNLFTVGRRGRTDFLCIHTEPLLFLQGSTTGHYASTCDPGVCPD